jgi:hypothetical protein
VGGVVVVVAAVCSLVLVVEAVEVEEEGDVVRVV